jgi:hypothetical protein
MVSISICCSKCDRLSELILDINKDLVTEFTCDTCIDNEKAKAREKLINSLIKKWWEFWK